MIIVYIYILVCAHIHTYIHTYIYMDTDTRVCASVFVYSSDLLNTKYPDTVCFMFTS